MKRLLLLLFASLIGGFYATVSAQYVQEPTGNLSYSFGKFKNEQGVKLSNDDLERIFDSQQYSYYLKAKKKYKRGWLWTGVGIGCMAAGTGLWTVFHEDLEDEEYGYMPMFALYGGGLVCTIIGIPKTIIGSHRLKKIAKEYNQSQVSSSFGIQQYGVGFALTF